MDDLNCSGPVVAQTLRELEFINAWLGGNAVTLGGIEKLLRKQSREKEIVIADLGCGGGDMLKLIDRWATKNGYNVRLIGFDANPNIVDFAREHAKDYPRISFETMDIFAEAFSIYTFDIVIGTLFYHHFSSGQLVNFFSALRKQTRTAILINDIHRHPVAYYSIKYLTAMFSKSPMVKMDAPISVMRAFHKKELLDILRRAGFGSVDIRWKWAFRWQVLAFSHG
jgi:2-polyprenyl-3-methyl-5-hydroxy-6-metoxy-1,4-benzoquinol methylase